MIIRLNMVCFCREIRKIWIFLIRKKRSYLELCIQISIFRFLHKNKYFLHKNKYFQMFSQNICCGYSFCQRQRVLMNAHKIWYCGEMRKKNRGPGVQSIVSLTNLLMINSLTVVAKIFSNTLIFLLQKYEKLLHCKSYTHFFSKKYQCICHI